MIDWTEQMIAELRARWVRGDSVLTISQDMEISKNAVVGKAHRLNLPARQSPIKRVEDGQVRETPARILRVPKGAVTLQPLAAQPVVPVREAPLKRTRLLECCFLLGEPRTSGFRFCGAPSAPGSPYCAEHHRIAFVKPDGTPSTPKNTSAEQNKSVDTDSNAVQRPVENDFACGAHGGD